jgi:hypothetical protein
MKVERTGSGSMGRETKRTAGSACGRGSSLGGHDRCLWTWAGTAYHMMCNVIFKSILCLFTLFTWTALSGRYENLTHSLPIVRPSRASGFAQNPFAASQAVQVESYDNSRSFNNLTNLRRDFEDEHEEEDERGGAKFVHAGRVRRCDGGGNGTEKVAGAAGLEPVTSAVTGQRSNQLSYAPAWGSRTYGNTSRTSSGTGKNIRAADAKEVGVGNPAEETYCYPNKEIVCPWQILSTPSLLMLITLMNWKKGCAFDALSVLRLQSQSGPHTICSLRASEFAAA